MGILNLHCNTLIHQHVCICSRFFMSLNFVILLYNPAPIAVRVNAGMRQLGRVEQLSGRMYTCFARLWSSSLLVHHLLVRCSLVACLFVARPWNSIACLC